jgi:hypothetical protein
VETYLFRRTSARRSQCSSAAIVGGPTAIPGRRIFTTAVGRSRATTPIVDFICVEHSSPRGRASTDRSNRARLPSLCAPIGAKANRNVEGRGSSQPTAPLNCHGRARVQSGYPRLLSNPQVPIVHRAIVQSAKPSCAWQFPSAAQTVQPLPPKGHFSNEMTLWISCGSCVRSDSASSSIGPTAWALFKTSDSAPYHMLCAYFPKLGTHLFLVRSSTCCTLAIVKESSHEIPRFAGCHSSRPVPRHHGSLRSYGRRPSRHRLPPGGQRRCGDALDYRRWFGVSDCCLRTWSCLWVV